MLEVVTGVRKVAVKMKGWEKLVVVAVVENVDDTVVLMLHTTVVCTLHMHTSPW